MTLGAQFVVECQDYNLCVLTGPFSSKWKRTATTGYACAGKQNIDRSAMERTRKSLFRRKTADSFEHYLYLQ